MYCIRIWLSLPARPAPLRCPYPRGPESWWLTAGAAPPATAAAAARVRAGAARLGAAAGGQPAGAERRWPGRWWCAGTAG
eukprot:1158215-Pelagomonas_calceolata.AAC.5